MRLKLAIFRRWAKGSREPVTERSTVPHNHFYSLSNNSKKQLGAPVEMWQQFSMYGQMVEIQSNLRRNKLHKTNQGSNFLAGSFSNRDNVWAPIQFGRKSQPQHLKRWMSIAPVLLDRSNKTSWVFPALK